MEVYTADLSALLVIPYSDVYHVPASTPKHNNSNNNDRLVLCPHFNPNMGPHSCPAGPHCDRVHALAANAERRDIHINYAWRHEDLVCYPRGTHMTSGATLHVALPNERTATDFISPSLVLDTAALRKNRTVHTHCAHYYYSRVCNLGSRCTFIHAVYVDADAVDGQHAPPPSSMLGRPSPNESRRRRWLVNGHHSRSSAASSRYGESDDTSSSSSGSELSNGSRHRQPRHHQQHREPQRPTMVRPPGKAPVAFAPAAATAVAASLAVSNPYA